MTFSARPVGSGTLGERLKRLREDGGKTLEAASEATGVHARYLEAIESSDYAKLPGALYAKRYVSAYARFLGTSEQAVLEEFEREYPVAAAVASKPKHPGLADLPRSITAVPLGRRILLGLAIFGVLVYLGWEAFRLLVPPPLTVTAPPEPFTTNQLRTEVSGRSAPEATVTINGEPVPVDARGQFREVVELAPGDRVLAITAKRPTGRVRTVLRHITVTARVPEPAAGP